MAIVAIDHVQLAMPRGGEDRARAFYVGVLELEELPKPEPLQGRGGAWFAAGAIQIHLGVDPEFRPARKAHPALVVTGSATMSHGRGRLDAPSRRTIRYPATIGFSSTIRSATGSS